MLVMSKVFVHGSHFGCEKGKMVIDVYGVCTDKNDIPYLGLRVMTDVSTLLYVNSKKEAF